jgi:hypothetical protein
MKVDIIKLYQQVFGYVGIPQPKMFIQGPRVEVELSDSDMFIRDDAKYEGTSVFGTPLFMPCRLDDYMLPNEPLITINGQNTIVKTLLTGVKGSVKEIINSDDYVIKIQGIIVNEDSDDLPEDDIRTMRTILEKKDSIFISNRLLTLFDIHQVVIESFTFPGVEGQQNCQAYEINCISDWPIELMLKDQK